MINPFKAIKDFIIGKKNKVTLNGLKTKINELISDIGQIDKLTITDKNTLTIEGSIGKNDEQLNVFIKVLGIEIISSPFENSIKYSSIVSRPSWLDLLIVKYLSSDNKIEIPHKHSETLTKIKEIFDDHNC